ncbi:putative sec1-like protein [Helianthus annuus]|uniref:Sec1-like protein n=1 Tax=Helianthus annuus TaxID=4232 RepID=A0A9K3DKD6_HELAN|nr:putative sec1-like protein [Helianthus annuus]KAJ0806986.1 putative sec1-like protein [Helianthus annuus]
MKEVNLEYFAIYSQCFITDNTMALEELYGNEEMTRKGDRCLNLMANRIATVFASLLEFPLIRYHAAKSLDPTTMTTIRDLIPTKLAAAVWNCLMKYKSLKNFNFPQTETCELLILDRSIDQVCFVNAYLCVRYCANRLDRVCIVYVNYAMQEVAIADT